MTATIERLFREALEIWLAGGGAMIALAVIALVMFSMGMQIHLRLGAKGFLAVPERTWRRWIDRPSERSGPIGRLLDFVMGGNSIEDTGVFFEELRVTETAPFERDLRVMKVCVGAAPLVGLLGTVIGMLATFGALASGSGGDKTMSMVASGISEALITTETGLVVALPGLFFQYQLARKHERYKAFLAHLESVCTQYMHHRGREAREDVVRRVARQRVAEALRLRMSQQTDGRATLQGSPRGASTHA